MKKDKHINTYDDLEMFFSMTGHIFPRTELDLKNAVKLHNDIDFKGLSEKIKAEEIWDAENPIRWNIKEIPLDANDEISSSWAMAARGNSELSKETLEKILRNQKKKEE